jgi:TolA-binding protein
LYTIADAQYNLGNIDDALSTYRSVIARFPAHPLAAESAKSMQIALIGMGRTDEALQIADSLISINPNSVVAEEFAFKKAEIFYTGRNYPNAVAELEAYINKYPSSKRNDEVLYLLGKTYLNMDDVVNASQSFTELEKQHPKSPLISTSLLELATYYDGHANSTMADSLYAAVMQRHADDTSSASRAGFERATLAKTRGDSLKALELYNITANRYAGTEYGDQSRYQIAMYYRKLPNVDSAVYHLSILSQSSTNPLIVANALYDIGDIYQRNGSWTSAAEAFERVRRDYAGYEDWYTLSLLGLGNCYEQLERFDDARSTYLVVRELRPDDDYGKTAISRLNRLERRRP